MHPELSLLVLRCRDIESSKAFYSGIGLTFVVEKHGAGVEHYAAEIGNLVLELYPLRKEEVPDGSRLGFFCSDLEQVSEAVRRTSSMSTQERDGKLVLIVQDPDGRKIELSQVLHAKS